MGRPPRIPTQLTRGPFTLEDARRAGLDRWHLTGASWRRIGPRTYARTGHLETPELMLAAAQHRLPSGAVFSGFTAAWLHGLDVAPCSPIEVTIPKGLGVSARAGMAIRRAQLDKGDVVTLRGMRATSVLRTLGDLCRRLSLTEAVVVIDMALHMRRAALGDWNQWVATRGRHAGVVKMRRAAGFAEPASESPMETRLRMLLVLAGLPRPQAQVPLRDRQGHFLGRADLCYPHHGLALEYDGAVHRASLAQDNRRQNLILGAGIRMLRFTAGDVLRSPDIVVAQVRAMLENPRVHAPAGFALNPNPPEHAPAGSATGALG